MSFLKSKHSGWLSDGTRTPFTGGGGSPGPSQNTTVTSNIPEYAAPYVTNMLEATQRQLFTGNKTPEGDFSITGFTPYTPYSTDVNNYYAGFSPLQKQAQMDAGAMQQPGQFALGSGLAGSAGIRSLGAAGQYGQNVTNKQRIDASGKPMFDQYNNPIFDASNTTQSFMSPYQQNVTDFAKQAAVREAQMAQNAQNLGAARQGTYGGARQTLSNMERERNLLSNLSNIQTQGAQSAYDRAMQTQQFGANLGMQGYGQALGAGSTLGQIGATQQATDIARQNQMAGMGQQQQALEQNKINQAIQDYATQQQYPLMQLGVMSNMLRGLPMQATSTQSYQAQPSTLQQGIGLAGAAGTLLGGRAEGGVIKMAEGGITGYKYGGAIPGQKLEGMAAKLEIPQLVERIKDPALTPGERQVFQEALAAKQQTASRSSGIAAAGGGLFDTMGYAGGGILAFAGDEEYGSLINSDIDPETGEPYKSVNPLDIGRFARKGQSIAEYYKEKTPGKEPTEADRKAQAQMEIQDIEGSKDKDPTVRKPAVSAGQSDGATGKKASSAAGSDASGISGILASLRKEGPKGELGSDYLKRLQDLESGADKRLSKADRLAMAKGFLKFGSTPAPGGIGQAAVAGLSEYAEGYGKAVESDEKFRMENAKLQSDIQNLRRAEERGDVKLAAELQEKIEDRANRLQTANISASAATSGRAQDAAYVKQLMAQGMSLEQALQAVKGAGKAESNDIARAKAALAQINEQLLLMKKDDPARAALLAQRDQITQALTSGASAQTTGSGGGSGIMRFDAQGNLVKG
jgi:hypothetical protein